MGKGVAAPPHNSSVCAHSTSTQRYVYSCNLPRWVLRTMFTLYVYTMYQRGGGRKGELPRKFPREPPVGEKLGCPPPPLPWPPPCEGRGSATQRDTKFAPHAVRPPGPAARHSFRRVVAGGGGFLGGVVVGAVVVVGGRGVVVATCLLRATNLKLEPARRLCLRGSGPGRQHPPPPCY